VLRCQQGAGTTEYVVLIVLAGLGAILLFGKFGTSVGKKVEGAGKRVETMGEDHGGHIVPRSASSGKESQQHTAGGSAVSETGASGSDGTVEEPPTDLLPERIDGGEGASAKTVDTKTVVLLGIIVVAVGALMILAVAQRVRKDRKQARR
jgi:hypothetical protein